MQIINYIPGFRSNKTYKKIMASAYYVFYIYAAVASIYINNALMYIAYLFLPVWVCSMFSFINGKYKVSFKNIFIGLLLPLALFVGGVTLPVSEPKAIGHQQALKHLNITEKQYNDAIKNK